ncbi:MAG: universal stress protein [Bryobacteraceae bacterium]|jgi:nucleotide-binding universal stress UspA family protein
MLPFKKILFPVDFSQQCAGAARYAEAFAGRFDAELTLMHVIAHAHYNDLIPVSPADLRRRLDSFLAKELDYFRVQRVLEEGDPASVIVNYAVQEHFDLIMLPTHGLGDFRRFLLGSVTAKVLHDSDCPVWTGVHLAQAPQLENIVFRNFLCSVDLGPQFQGVVECAAELAEQYRAKLSVLHVVPEPAGAAEVRQTIEGLLPPAAKHASVLVEAGEVAKTVSCVATRVRADLLVIGRNPAPGMFGRLRTDAYSIIRQSPCPVISV